MSAGLIDRIVAVSAGVELGRVPNEVIEQAGHVIADTIGVSYGGAREPEMVRLIALAREQGLIGEKNDIANGTSSSAAGNLRAATVHSAPNYYAASDYAAFLNASAGSFLEMDEGVRPTGHPAMHVVTAAVATAERVGASGSDLLRAVIAGYETTSRLFRGFRLRYPVHPHGHIGGVGAAVAVALLEGVDPVVAARIAATSPLLTIWDACYDGATARNTWMGQAAQSAVRAAMMAKAGFIGSSQAFEIAFGQIAGELVDEEALVEPLDYSGLGITRNYFKLHSACALNHAALDAIFKLDIPEPARIERILVETVSNNMKLNRQPQPNSLSGRFSLPYAMATAAMVGRSDPDAFTFKPEVAELAQRVEIRTADDLESYWPNASPARVTIWADGESMMSQVSNPHGHFSEPVTGAELKAKFLELVSESERGVELWTRLTALTGVENCANLFTQGKAK